MNKINLGPNLAKSDEMAQAGEVFMAHTIGETHVCMLTAGLGGKYLVDLKTGLMMNGMDYSAFKPHSIVEDIDSWQGEWKGSYVGSCNITIEHK